MVSNEPLKYYPCFSFPACALSAGPLSQTSYDTIKANGIQRGQQSGTSLFLNGFCLIFSMYFRELNSYEYFIFDLFMMISIVPKWLK